MPRFDFVRDAFGHLKAIAIAIDEGDQQLLLAAGLTMDRGVVAAEDDATFIGGAKTRCWQRESSIRTLA